MFEEKDIVLQNGGERERVMFQFKGSIFYYNYYF